MLRVSRSKGQCLRLTLEDGRIILIEVADIRSGISTLAISAPATVYIDREEWLQAKSRS